MKGKRRYGSRILAVIMAAAMGMSSVPELVRANEILAIEETGAPEVETQRMIWMDTSKSVDERVSALLSVMTLEEKAAQMVQPEQGGGGTSEGNRPATPEDVKAYGIGSVLSGGGSAPSSGNSAEDWENRINEFKAAALESRLGIPLIYGVDAVHGHNNVDDAVIFPHNIGLGAANNEEIVEKIGAAAAEEIRATGIEWTFAPTLGIPDSERWGRYYECFGEDPTVVSDMGAAYVKGFQQNGVAATAKHYIGEGQTQNGVNQGNVVTSEYGVGFDELMEQKQLLAPYQAAIEAGAYTVMASYNSVDGVKCHANKHLLTDVLKGNTETGGLGFKGFVVSDYNGVDQVAADSYEAKVAASIDAGVDMFMEPYDWENCMKAIIAGVNGGTISQERVDDAVSRILRVKFEMGLFEEEVADENEKELLEKFGGEEHRAVAREAAAKSLTVLKNDDVTIDGETKPVLDLLDDDGVDNILVAGYKGNDVGAQCGGWTISWQGGLDANNGSSGNKVTEGTTIYEGFQEAAGDDVTVSYNARGKISNGTDVAVVVVGEEPYAESNGDKKAEELTLTDTDLNVIKTAVDSKGDVPAVLVLMTGRPVAIADFVDDFDAVVEAWLPGSEGAALADVMLDETKDFSATSPVTWTWYPEYLTQKNDPSKVLFPRGTGLKKDGTSIKDGGQTDIPGTENRPDAPEKADEQAVVKYKNGVDIDKYGNKLEGEYYNTSGTYASWLVDTYKDATESGVSFTRQDWANAKWSVYFRQAGEYTVSARVDAQASGTFVFDFSNQLNSAGDDLLNAETGWTTLSAAEGYRDVRIGGDDFKVTVNEPGLYYAKIMDTTQSWSSAQLNAKLDYLQFNLIEGTAGDKDEGVEEPDEDPTDETAKASNGNLLSQDAVKVWMTSSEKSQSMDWYKYPTEMVNQLSEKDALDITSVDNQELTTINVNPDKTYQEFLGMGTSLEESTINNLSQLRAEVQDEFLRKLVDPDQAGMTLFRITIGTSDFTSKKFYTYYDAKELTEANAIKNADGTLSPDWQNTTGNGFSIQKDIDYKIVDTVKKVMELAKEYGVEDEIKFFASSWTPPGWMKSETTSSKSYKDNDLLIKGGSLNDKYIDDLAMYYTRYLEEYAKQGIDIYAMTLQNEPMLEIDYPSCAMSGEQEGKLAVAIKQAVNNSKILTNEQKKCKLWAFDHNPSGAYDYTAAILRVDGANEALDGVAFHDYGGSLTEMQRVLDNLLNKDGRTDQTVNLTERSVWGTSGANSIITYFRNSAISYNSWVTMLDSNVGVHQWVGTPDPTMFARAAGSDNDYWAMPEFYITGQFSRFIRPGYVRVDSNLGSTDTVTNVVFKNPETGELVAVVVNATDKKQNFKIVTNGTQFIGAIPAKNIATYVWSEPENVQNNVDERFSATNYAMASEGVTVAKDDEENEYVTTTSDADYIDYIINVKEAGSYGIIFEQQPTEDQKIGVYQGDTLLREIVATKTWNSAKVKVRGAVTFERAGIQQIRVKASSGVKLYNISLEKTPAVHSIPGKILADQYEEIVDNDGNIKGATVNDAHQVENTDAWSTIRYKVNVPADDTYTFTLASATDAGGENEARGYYVIVDKDDEGDDDKGVLGNVEWGQQAVYTPSNSWDMYTESSVDLELKAGEHMIGIKVASPMNLAWFSIGSYMDITAPEITEGSEDAKEITLDITGGTIADGDMATLCEVTGLPEGVTAELTKVSDTKVRLTLNGNRSNDFDENQIVTISIQVKQANNNAYAVTGNFVITAVNDEETISLAENQDLQVPENVGDTKEVYLKLTGGTFRKDKVNSITVSGDAAGFYKILDVSFVDSATIKVLLTYSKKFYRPVKLAFNVPAEAYDDGNVTLTADADMEPVEGFPEAIELSDAAITLTEEKAYANSGSLTSDVAKDNYVDYFLDVKQAGTYSITYTLHTLTNDGTAYQNAVDINRGVPDTIGTNSYKQLSLPALWISDEIKMRDTVEFEAGKQTLEFKAKSAGWVISSIEIAPVNAVEITTDKAGTTISATDLYGAENSHAIIGDKIEYGVAGTTLYYMVKVTKSGTYKFNTNYAIEGSGNVKIKADRIISNRTTTLGTVAIPATGGWNTFKNSDDLNIDLPVGTYTLRIALEGDGANLKELSLKLLEEKQIAVIPVECVTFASKESTVEAGTKLTLVAQVEPKEADDKTVTWSTSNEAVASVEDGVIFAKAVGTAVITATSNENPAIKAEYTLHVTEKKQGGNEDNNNTDKGEDKTVAVTGISLNRTDLTISKGKTATLTATVIPANATNQTVTWSSDNKQVATVDASGTVKAVAKGTAKITATVGDKTADCVVTVEIPATKVKLNARTVYMVKGKKLKIKATMTPDDTTDKLSVSNSKKAVATTSLKKNIITIKAKKPGKTIITVKTTSGRSYKCTVNVVNKATKSTKIKLNKKALSIKKGDSYDLVPKLTKKISTDTVKWNSSNKKIAVVDAYGTVTGKKGGTVTITAKTSSGKKATCKVTVKVASTKVAITKKTVSIKLGATTKLKAELTPSDSNDTLKWTTSNKKIVTVDKKGKVKGVKKGMATITVKTTSGKKATCKVKVK